MKFLRISEQGAERRKGALGFIVLVPGGDAKIENKYCKNSDLRPFRGQVFFWQIKILIEGRRNTMSIICREFAENPVQIAVDRVGGPTKASVLLGVSNWTVHSWIRSRRISNIDYARTLAKESRIALEELRPTR